MRVEDRVVGGGVEDRHVARARQVLLVAGGVAAGGDVDEPVRAGLDHAAGRQLARGGGGHAHELVGRAIQQPVHERELVIAVVAGVEVGQHALDRLAGPQIAVLVEERVAAGPRVRGRHGAVLPGLPVPVRQPQREVADQAAQDALVEVQEHAVPGQEVPAPVDVAARIARRGLRAGHAVVGVEVALALQAAAVRGGQRAHLRVRRAQPLDLARRELPRRAARRQDGAGRAHPRHALAGRRQHAAERRAGRRRGRGCGRRGRARRRGRLRQRRAAEQRGRAGRRAEGDEASDGWWASESPPNASCFAARTSDGVSRRVGARGRRVLSPRSAGYGAAHVGASPRCAP